MKPKAISASTASLTRWSSGESGGNCLGHFGMSQPFQKSPRKQADFACGVCLNAARLHAESASRKEVGTAAPVQVVTAAPKQRESAARKKQLRKVKDMALVPELNVRMRVEAGMFVVEVSPELYDVFR